MASTVSIYKGPVLLGTASCSAASASLTSFSAGNNVVMKDGKNLTVTVTQSGTHAGRSWNTRVISGSGTSTLVLEDACPFVGA